MGQNAIAGMIVVGLIIVFFIIWASFSFLFVSSNEEPEQPKIVQAQTTPSGKIEIAGEKERKLMEVFKANFDIDKIFELPITMKSDGVNVVTFYPDKPAVIHNEDIACSVLIDILSTSYINSGLTLSVFLYKDSMTDFYNENCKKNE